MYIAESNEFREYMSTHDNQEIMRPRFSAPPISTHTESKSSERRWDSAAFDYKRDEKDNARLLPSTMQDGKHRDDSNDIGSLISALNASIIPSRESPTTSSQSSSARSDTNKNQAGVRDADHHRKAASSQNLIYRVDKQRGLDAASTDPNDVLRAIDLSIGECL